MNTTVDDPNLAHRRTWELIPWLVNGCATPGERACVEAHLVECVDCRDELAFQSLLQAGMMLDTRAPDDAGAAFARLMTRIDREDREDAELPVTSTTGVRPPAPGRSRRPTRTMRASRRLSRLFVGVLALQSVGLVLLGTLLLARPGGHDPLPAADALARYETLSSPRPAAGAATIRFVPSPTLSVGAMQAILAQSHLRIVGSNQGSAIYDLAAQDDADPAHAGAAERASATATALARLRATPGVLLAEPIGTALADPR